MRTFKFLAHSIAVIILFSESHLSSAVQDFIEIKKIDGTGLFTGLWYTIGLKSNNGRLSWSYTIIQPWSDCRDPVRSSLRVNHVQVVFDNAVDVADFQPGEKFFNDTQWMFAPSEKSGLYSLYNKGIPHAVLTWAGGDADKKFVGIDLYFNNSNYEEGGKYWSDRLWSIKLQPGSSDAQYYNIFNGRFLNSGSGIMTISDQGIATGKKHVEVYVSKNADKGGSAEYLWKITPTHPVDSSNLTEQLSTLKAHEQYLCGRLD